MNILKEFKIIFLILAFLTISSPLYANCVTAYSDTDFKGKSWTFCSNKPQPNKIFWSDKISSIKVPKGTKVKVCKGTNSICRSYFRDVSNTGFFNNNISNLVPNSFQSKLLSKILDELDCFFLSFWRSWYCVQICKMIP